MMTSWLAALIGGCTQLGGETDAPIRSRPTEPTVEFGDPHAPDPAIVWTDLEDLFPQRPAALPELLAALEPELNGARAREILEAAHQPGAKVFGEMTKGDLVLSSILRGMNTVQASVVLADGGKTLREVHVELPDEVAIPMLTTRWGEAAAVEHVDGGSARYTWQAAGGGWQATLYPEITTGRALVRYTISTSTPSTSTPSTSTPSTSTPPPTAPAPTAP
jgi:hypothetical protein